MSGNSADDSRTRLGESLRPHEILTDDEARALVADATEVSSSFNIQHWRFVALTDPAQKRALVSAAYGQTKIAEAAVTFVVLSDIEGHKKLRSILDQSVAARQLPPHVADPWVEMLNGMYWSNPPFVHDEAIRSASLAAVALMLSAKARGLVRGPRIGFDPAQVK